MISGQGKKWQYWFKLFTLSLFIFPLLMLMGSSHEPAAAPDPKAHTKQMEALMVKAGLSQAQLQNVRDLRAKGKAKAEGLKKQVEEKHQALRKYLSSPDSTEHQAQVLEAEISHLQEEINSNRIHTLFQMRQVMSADQLKKFLIYRAQLKDNPNNHYSCKK